LKGNLIEGEQVFDLEQPNKLLGSALDLQLLSNELKQPLHVITKLETAY